jgi:hypothetical protein
MDAATVAQFRALGSNSEAKKMFALEYFTRAMERFETGTFVRDSNTPDWAAWTKSLAKQPGICNADGCTNQWKMGDPVWVMYGKKPRCLTCGRG